MMNRMARLLWLVTVLLVGVGPVRANRMRTVGWETNSFDADGFFEGQKTLFTNGTVTSDTTTFRSGSRSLQFNIPLGGTGEAFVGLNVNSSELPAVPMTVYVRSYFRFSKVNGAGTNPILQILGGALNPFAFVNCQNNTGAANNTKLDLRIGANTTVGSPSAALNDNQWYRVELSYGIDGSNLNSAELRIDGVSIASTSGVTVGGATLPVLYQVGLIANQGGLQTINADDFALNNSAGANQNSWPGEGSIVLLKPNSDNARTGWLTGAGGTTSLFSAVLNTPPIGKRDSSATATSQIKDTVSSTTDNYNANLTSYTAAGVPSGNTITVAQALCNHGTGSTSASKSGGLQIVSNPAQTGEDAFVFGNNAATAGTWPTGWASVWGTAQCNPVVTLGTAPVLRVGKRTASAAEVDVDFMGVQAEYVSSVASVPKLPLLGVGNP